LLQKLIYGVCSKQAGGLWIKKALLFSILAKLGRRAGASAASRAKHLRSCLIEELESRRMLSGMTATTIALSVPDGLQYREDFVVSAHVTSADGLPVNSGSVEIEDYPVGITVVPVHNGIATLAVTRDQINYSFQAHFEPAPDSALAPSDHDYLQFQPTPLPITVAVTPSGLGSRYLGDPELYTVKITQDGNEIANPAGQFWLVHIASGFERLVDITDGKIYLGGSPGTEQYALKYVDWDEYRAGESEPFDVVVGKALTMIDTRVVDTWKTKPVVEVSLHTESGNFWYDTLTISEGDVLLGSIETTAEWVRFELPDWAPGERIFTVHYAGSDFFESTEAQVRLVDRGPASVSIEAPARIIRGEAITLHARVMDGVVPASGMVAFFDEKHNGETILFDGGQQRSGSVLGTQMLDSQGNADLQLTTLGPGAHHIQAIYLGLKLPLLDYTNLGPVPAVIAPPSELESSSSQQINVAVVEPTKLQLQRWFSATPTHSPTFTATVTNAAGEALRTMSPPKDQGFTNSNWATLSIHIPRPAPPRPATTPWPWSGGGGYGVIIHCYCPRTPLPPVPTGIVKFMQGGKLLASVPVDATGTATFKPGKLRLGQHQIVATYSGDDRYDASSSEQLQYEVTKTQTSLKITASKHMVRQGDNLMLTAGVSTDHDPVWPTGWIVLKDGKKTLARLKMGKPITQVDFDLSVGTHVLTAIYEGDKNCFGSESIGFKLRVKPA
jgi:hypothetical protein